MRRMIIGAAVFAGALAALRWLGPRLGERVMDKCEQMFNRMPEEFPPKRMMRSIEEIREQNTRILRRLHEPERLTSAAAD